MGCTDGVIGPNCRAPEAQSGHSLFIRLESGSSAGGSLTLRTRQKERMLKVQQQRSKIAPWAHSSLRSTFGARSNVVSLFTTGRTCVCIDRHWHATGGNPVALSKIVSFPCGICCWALSRRRANLLIRRGGDSRRRTQVLRILVMRDRRMTMLRLICVAVGEMR